MTMTRFHASTALALGIISSNVSSAATHHVPKDHPTIQACIDAAVNGEDECVVAPGTYPEVINFVGKGITVRSSDGPEVTIIDATGIGGSVVKCINHEGPATVLRGFTITGGTGTNYGLDNGGGGMLNSLSAPTVIDCHFRGNTATIGAGIYNFVWADPTIIDCTFSNNVAHIGGGIFNFQSSPMVRGCTFEGNSAPSGGGGAIGGQFNAAPIVEQCVFRENDAYLGGALYNDLDSRPTLTDCVFERNAAFNGGAIFSGLESEPRMTRVTFVANTAENNGGAVYIENPNELAMMDCTFVDNRAKGDGGGVRVGYPWSFFGPQLFTGSSFVGNVATRGGALYFEWGNQVELRECLVRGNEAAFGGGVFLEDDVDATLVGCEFVSNYAERGGGLYAASGNIHLEACAFEKNAAEQEGGAMFKYPQSSSYWDDTVVVDSRFLGNRAGRGGAICLYGGRSDIQRCGFDGNTAMDGGALYVGGTGSEVVDCTFDSNRAELNAGAINVGWGGGVIDHCAFRENSAEGGGAFFTSHTDPLLVTDCLFQKNTAGIGGAVFTESYEALAIERSSFQGNRADVMGGGITLGSLADAFVRNCGFIGNTSEWGGAIHNDSYGLFAEHCTFANNYGGSYGGAITNDFDAIATVSHSVFWNNNLDEIYEEVGSQLTLRFCDIRGGLPSGAVDEGGNFVLDPLFIRNPDPGLDGEWNDVDDDYGDLRLLGDSPCIDAGDVSFVPTSGETDLDGHARVLCERVDIGVYEFGIGDFDCDRTIDLDDFAGWGECMTGPSTTDIAVPHCVAFDFDANGTVDLLDLRLFVNLLTQP